MSNQIVQWARDKSYSSPVAFGFTAGIVLGAVLIPLILIFPWLMHYDDPRWQVFSSASLILILIVANKQFAKHLRSWISLTAVALAHLAVLLIFTKLVAHPSPNQYLLLTYIDMFVGEWIVVSTRDRASTLEESGPRQG